MLVRWKLLPRKLPPRWFSPDNSHPKNSHQRKFPPRITPTRRGKLPLGQFPTGKFPPRIIFFWTIPTRKTLNQLTATPDKCYPANLTIFLRFFLLVHYLKVLIHWLSGWSLIFLSVKEACRLLLNTSGLVVSDLHSETKGSRFESGCWLCAEVSSLQ